MFTVPLAIAACDEKLSDLTGPTPNLEPTFSSIKREIFETTDASGRLACTNCHSNLGGRNPSGGMNLLSGVSYADLVGVASTGSQGPFRVIPGDPDNSYIIHKLEGRSDIIGVRMPTRQWTLPHRWPDSGHQALDCERRTQQLRSR